MSHSEQTDKLAAALVRVQTGIKPAVKSSSNPFFKSKYADLGEVWAACREALAVNGIAVVQGGYGGELVTTLLHSSGQWISGSFPLTPVKPDPQAMGSAISYMRRYSLAAMVGVIAEDDDGEAAMARGNGHAPSPAAAPKPQPIPRSNLMAEWSPEDWQTWAKAVASHDARTLADWLAGERYAEDMELLGKASPRLRAWLESKIAERNAA